MTEICEALYDNNEDKVTPSVPPRFSLGGPLTFVSQDMCSILSIPMPANDVAPVSPKAKERHDIGSLWALPDQALVNTSEAAAMLGRSPRTLEGWRLRHCGPPYQIGGRVTYAVGDLRQFKELQTVNPRR